MSDSDKMMPSDSALTGRGGGPAGAELGSELGGIDFTGRRFPAEPLAVFQPCITLAIDDVGRRWIAETGDGGAATGPVWCVFPQPQVAVYVSDELAAFERTLQDRAREGSTLQWLQGLTAQARAIWSRRHSMGQRLRAGGEERGEEGVKQWMARLPLGARIYDLREPADARGLPYGMAGTAGRIYRCERLPVFAIAGRPLGRFWVRAPAQVVPDPPTSGAAGAMMALAPPAFRLHRCRDRRDRRRPAAAASLASCA